MTPEPLPLAEARLRLSRAVGPMTSSGAVPAPRLPAVVAPPAGDAPMSTSRVKARAPARMDSGAAGGSVDAKSTALLRIQDVADLLRCSAWTVRGMIDAGKLPVVRLPGRLVRVDPSDLAALIAACRDA